MHGGALMALSTNRETRFASEMHRANRARESRA
jgi:hypothetical protein